MVVRLNQEWKNEIQTKIEQKKKENRELFTAHINDILNYELRIKYEYSERELSFLKGQMMVIELIEMGCYIEGIDNTFYNAFDKFESSESCAF